MGCGASARKKESPDKKKSDSAEGPNAEKTEEAEGTRLHKAPQTKTQDDADLFAESPRHSIGGGAISPRGSASLGVPTPRERERGRQSKVQRVTEICEALDVDATPPEGTGRSLLESGGMKACASLLRALLRPGGSFLSAHVQGGAEGEGVSRERVSAELPPGNKAEEDIFRDLADADLALRGMLGLLCEPGGTTLFRSSRVGATVQ
uniref:Uncharacterized protein n=1 Tax=Chromera velia CCMP2878 TaxID=1169474 RepID=A0A0G4HMA4_9ALVE|eukprot:Cvel_7464.t1-p1 / transcript=Cvel_7464.t1 / gene=Cvel_7464 / organism=Chromera_velia_CCMP2878 / gene_product=hypothetical protein / transcript_product=hypothetical protein / location=Cvel_scaffold390:91859-92476(+) / protein_length=206 / sequence_SO=supercontig / SO=protein_coding / is_pseudo=false